MGLSRALSRKCCGEGSSSLEQRPGTNLDHCITDLHTPLPKKTECGCLMAGYMVLIDYWFFNAQSTGHMVLENGRARAILSHCGLYLHLYECGCVCAHTR